MIREIAKTDIPECVAVIRGSFKTVADEFGFTSENAPRFAAFATTEERLLRQFDDPQRIMLAYYTDDGVIAGYYSLHLLESNGCEINNVSVLPEFRHQGIGSALLEDALERAKALGLTCVNLGIVEENRRLRAWYEAHGFIHTGTRKFDWAPFTSGFMTREL